MDRRDLLKGAAFGGVAGSALGLISPYVQAAQGSVASSEAERALAELMAMLAELDADFSRPEWRLRSPQDFAEARRLLLHTLTHGLQVWMEADPARPFFRPFIDTHKKLLGDNPDARYHSAVIDDRRRYRIFGNLADANYTSFTVELGVGSESSGLGSTLNDSPV